MPAIERLTKRPDFLQVAKQGRRWVTPAFVLQVLENAHNHSEACCVGFTVTKKTFKKAVDRNRVKRRLREVARLTLPPYDIGQAQLVFIGREEALTRDFADIQKDCHWALRKLGIEKSKKKEAV